MSISISGRIVKARKKSDLKRIEHQASGKLLVDKYNHLRIHFADGAERHFLFTDKQVLTAIECAKENLKEQPKFSWMREVWYDGVMSTGRAEVRKIMEEYGLPEVSKKMNHVRVCLGESDIHMLFTDGAVRSGLSRAKKEERYLPKVSWLSDNFEEKAWVSSQEKLVSAQV